MSITAAVVVASREALSTWTLTSRSRHDEIAGSKFSHVRTVHAAIVHLNGLSAVSWQDPQRSGVADSMALATDILPCTRISVLGVEEELVICGVTHDDSTRRTASGSPDSVRTCARDTFGSPEHVVAN